MFWVYVPTNPQPNHFLVKGNNSSNEWSLTYSSSNQVIFNQQNVYTALYGPSLQGKYWETCRGIIGRKLLSSYMSMVNRQERLASPCTPSATELVIGNIANCAFCALDGNMAEVVFFDQALSSAEISDPHEANRSPSSFSSLVGYWPLNSNTTTATDLSGNGLYGNINAAVWTPTCPMEDLDGDGYDAMIDCDDNDAIIPSFLAGDSYGDGIDSDCDGLDCEADFDGNGVYFSVCIDSNQKSFVEAEAACLAGGYDGVALPEHS